MTGSNTYTERLEQFFVANGITEEGKKLAYQGSQHAQGGNRGGSAIRGYSIHDELAGFVSK